MKKAIIEIEVEDDFIYGDYENCPLAEDNNGNITCFYECENYCPLQIKEATHD